MTIPDPDPDPDLRSLLSLPQRMYLLCYDLVADRLGGDTAQVRGQLLRAAAVAELRLAGHLQDRDGRAVRGSGDPHDPFLADVLGSVPVGGTAHWFTVVDTRWWAADASVRDQLLARGVVTASRRRWLGIVPHLRVAPSDPAGVGDLRERVRGVVLDDDPTAPPLEDAVLAEIAIDGTVGTAFTHREFREHRPAVDALARRIDTALPGLRDAAVWSVAARRSATFA